MSQNEIISSPTLRESNYDPSYRLSARRDAQIAASAFDDFWRAYPKTVGLTEAIREPLLAHQRILRQIIDAQLGEWLGVKLLDLHQPNAMRDRALTRHRQLPQRETLHAWDDELHRALDGKADEHLLSVLLATMLDGFPRGMVPNVRTYVGGALLVMGHDALSPEILAAAIIRIWRKDRFLPTIAELQDEFGHACQTAVNARRVVTKMIALLDNAEEILIATGDIDQPKKAFPT